MRRTSRIQIDMVADFIRFASCIAVHLAPASSSTPIHYYEGMKLSLQPFDSAKQFW